MRFILIVPCISTVRAAGKKLFAAVVEAQVTRSLDMERSKKSHGLVKIL
jgi:hypothetical protein